MVARYSGSADVRTADATALPFAAEVFDRVLMASVTHYCPDLGYMRGALSEIARVLRPGGLAILTDVLVEPPPSGAPYMWYQPAELASAVATAGCTYEVATNDLGRTGPRTRVDLVVRKPSPPEPAARVRPPRRHKSRRPPAPLQGDNAG